MGITDFVFRRGATYVWRRRLLTALGGALLQVSLRTNEPLLARRIAAKVTVASNNLFEHMTNTGLTRENARKLLDQVIRDEIERIQRRRIVESDDREENAWAANQSRDQMAAKAYRLLAERGRSASLSAAELETMRAADLTDTDLSRLDNFLELFRQDYWSDTRMRRIAGVLRDQFSLASPSATDLIQARQIMLRARGAAHHLMADRASTDMDEADALAAAIFEEFLQDQPDSAHATQGAFPPATVATTPLSAPPPTTEAVPPPHPVPSSPAPVPQIPPLFDPDFIMVAHRLLPHAQPTTMPIPQSRCWALPAFSSKPQALQMSVTSGRGMWRILLKH